MTVIGDRMKRSSRRGILASAGALGLGMAAAAAVDSTRTQAAAGDPMLAGRINESDLTTTLTGSPTGQSLFVQNLNDGDGANAIMGLVDTPFQGVPKPAAIFGKDGRLFSNGVLGEAFIGVRGVSTAPKGTGLRGEANNTTQGFGVVGEAGSAEGAGVVAQNFAGDGVRAFGATGVSAAGGGPAARPGLRGAGVDAVGTLVGVFGQTGVKDENGPGVWGNAGQEINGEDGAGTQWGVLGTSPTIGVAGAGGGADIALLRELEGAVGVAGVGIGTRSRGVVGVSDESDGVAVLATGGRNAVALSVLGINEFTQVGRDQFAAGEKQKVITGARATTRSGILVTLNSSPGPGVSLHFARVNPATGRIVLRLTRPPKRPVRFTYFIVDATSLVV